MSLVIASKHLRLWDAASPALQEKMAAIEPKRLAAKMGPPLMRHWRDHLKRQPRNRRGWPSTGFWEEAAESIQYLPQTDGLKLVGSKQGLRFRFLGGQISAQTADALTIPISPVSYGHRASEFPGAFLITTKTGAYIVQHGMSLTETGRVAKVTKRAGGNSGRRLIAHLNFLFKLQKSVRQKANPNVIPGDLLDVAVKTIEEALSE